MTLRVGFHKRPGVQVASAPNRGRVCDEVVVSGVVELNLRADPHRLAWHKRHGASACNFVVQGRWLERALLKSPVALGTAGSKQLLVAGGVMMSDLFDGRDERCACRRTAHRVFTAAATRPQAGSVCQCKREADAT